MLAETMEEYTLASAEAAYENPGEQAPMVFMASGREIQVVDGPEMFIFPLPDWHREYQLRDRGRMKEYG